MTLNPIEVIKKANEVAAKIFENEKFAVSALHMRAKKAAENHPNDQTLRMMHNVLNKMSANGKVFISRGEVRDLYNTFATANNKAADYFANELHLAEPPKAKIMQYAENPDIDVVTDAISAATDSAMYNALSQIWDDSGKLSNSPSASNMYSEDQAKKAESIVGLTLTRLGVNPTNIKRFAGSDAFVICDASYQTPIGEAHLLVPVQFSKSGALIPNMFVSKFGFTDLTSESVRAHIRDSAGKNMSVNTDGLLDTLNGMQKLSSMDDIEFQAIIAQASLDQERGMIKMASSAKENEQVALTTNPVFISEIDPVQVEMSLPEADGKQTFAALLDTPKGMAEHLFGKSVVENGRTSIINRFASMGLKSQVVVSACDDDSLIYAAKVDTRNGPLGFEVLLDVTNKNKPHLPNVIAVKDKVYEFTSDGVNEAITHNNSDVTAIAKVSPMYDLKASEVLTRLRIAAENKDYKTAEDALNVLAVNGPEEVYSMAVAEYINSLSGMVKNASTVERSKCSMIVKSANHSCNICGHLNLPLDKVYQDAHGNCRPLYRKAMEETYEGVLLNTSKIFL